MLCNVDFIIIITNYYVCTQGDLLIIMVSRNTYTCLHLVLITVVLSLVLHFKIGNTTQTGSNVLVNI